MITILLFIVLLVLLLFVSFMNCYLTLYRNNKIRDYKIELNNRSCEICINYLTSFPDKYYRKEEDQYYLRLRHLWDTINDISYDKMLYQFWKPLKDEYWLTQEQIDFLNLKFEPNNTQK